jgi:alkylhydroperoxidase/carboxymuconolactone decarboxylase family protein YurZ
MPKLPKHYVEFMEKYPRVADAYDRFGRACHLAGPLDTRTRALVKLGIAIGGRLEGGSHAQIRKALDAGVTPDEIRHVALLALPTIGFPASMAALSWVEDLLGRSLARRKGRGKNSRAKSR